MAAPVPYLTFDGRAREALAFYAELFGGAAETHTFAAFGRDDGPSDAIAHGILRGPVELFAADAATGESTFDARGLLFSLLGASDSETLTRWFAGLAEGGTVVDPLQERPWRAWDGQVEDRFGVRWLIGWESSSA